MSTLIFALVVVIAVALGIWAVDLAHLPTPVNTIIKVVIVLLGLVVILNRSGAL